MNPAPRFGLGLPRVGLGCWAIGGHFLLEGIPDGWGQVDDDQSIRAIHLGLDLGARLIDTADVYGTGHSEEVIGRALAGRRHQAVIATKFGYGYEARTKSVAGTNLDPDYVVAACEASLRRLGTDHIDLYQIHVGELDDVVADRTGSVLERLAEAGKIGAWGWSTDNARAAARMLHFPHFGAVQQELSLFRDGPDMLALCEAEGLASLNRSPLAMGFLTGKFDAGTKMPVSDVRGAGHSWVRFFEDGRPKPEFLRRLDALRDLLQADGRSLAQGALGWILARSPTTLPVPGFKSEAQVRDNLGAIEKGPLPPSTMAEIENLWP